MPSRLLLAKFRIVTSSPAFPRFACVRTGVSPQISSVVGYFLSLLRTTCSNLCFFISRSISKPGKRFTRCDGDLLFYPVASVRPYVLGMPWCGSYIRRSSISLFPFYLITEAVYLLATAEAVAAANEPSTSMRADGHWLDQAARNFATGHDLLLLFLCSLPLSSVPWLRLTVNGIPFFALSHPDVVDSFSTLKTYPIKLNWPQANGPAKLASSIDSLSRQLSPSSAVIR